MALIQAGRQLPVLRYLTTLASYQKCSAFGICTSSADLYSSASGTDGISSGSAKKEEPGKPGSDSPAAATPAPTNATEAVVTNATEAGAASASTSQPATVDDDEEWTEVVHSSGQLYYWNQRTGETTQLGEPKPKSDKGSGGGGAGGDSGGSTGRAGSAGGGRAAEGHTHDPRAEAPMEDRTGTYASMGVIIGAFLGWVSQFV